MHLFVIHHVYFFVANSAYLLLAVNPMCQVELRWERDWDGHVARAHIESVQ